MSEVLCDCGQPTSGAWLCGRCELTLDVALANIAAYWHEATTPTDSRQVGGGDPAFTVDGRPVGGTATMPATQTKWDAWNTLVGWCRIVMDEVPEVPGSACPRPCLHVPCAEIRRCRYPDNDAGSMVRYLARQRAWVLGREWVPEMLGEMLSVERRLRRLVDIPPPRWYAGKCNASDIGVQILLGQPECTAELYATTDVGVIECPACGTRHDIATRREQLLTEAADHHVTASTAASALIAWTDYDGTIPKLTALIGRWRDADLLEVADVASLSGRDRHLYRLGDIQDLLVRHARYRRPGKASADVVC